MDNNGKENKPKKKSTTRRIVKFVLVALVVGFVLLAAAVIVVPALISTSTAEWVISQNTKENLGRPAKLGDFSMSLVGGLRVVISDLVIEDKEEYGDRPLLKVDKIILSADILPLLKKEIVVNKLSIENPQISVVKGKQGRFNFEDIPVKQEPAKKEPTDEVGAPFSLDQLPAVIISSFTVTNGAVHFADLETGQTSRIGDVNVEFVAEVRPAEMKGEITTARFSFDGFELTAAGSMGAQQGKPVVKGFAVDSKSDISKLGRLASPVLPVNIEGSMEYHLSADGPITAVKTKSEFSLTNFQATGARLRKPANIDGLVVKQSSVLNLEKMSVGQISSEVTSESLGVSGKLTGKIANLVESSGLDLKIAADVDIERLSAFADSFTAEPLEADGQLTFDTVIAGSPQEELSAKGRLLIADLRLAPPGLEQPYTDPRVDFAYDLTVREGTKLNIKKFELRSRLMTAEASGNLSPGAADMAASARADLAAVNSALAGMGLAPEDMATEGQFVGNLRAKTVEEGIEITAAGKVANFALASPELDEKYTDPEVAFGGSCVLGFADGTLDSIKRSEFKLASRLFNVDGNLVADKLATEPSFRCDIVAKTHLSEVGSALVKLGKLKKGTRIGGRMKAEITVATADREPPGEDARAVEDAHIPVLAANGLQAPLAPGPIVPGQAEGKPAFSDAVVISSTVTGDNIFYNNIRVDKSHTTLQLKQGRFTTDTAAQMGEGSVNFSEATNLRREEPSHEVWLTVKRVVLTKELDILLKNALPILALPLGEVTGVVDADAKLSAEGTEAEKLFSTLNGNGKLIMPQNMRVTIPVFKLVPVLGAFSSLPFGKMNSVFSIKDGLSTSDTVFTSVDLTMKLAGTTNLVTRKVPGVAKPGREINYTVAFTGERVGRDLKRFLDKEGRLPVRITGTLEDPKAKLVLVGFLGPLLKLFE